MIIKLTIKIVLIFKHTYNLRKSKTPTKYITLILESLLLLLLEENSLQLILGRDELRPDTEAACAASLI